VDDDHDRPTRALSSIRSCMAPINWKSYGTL
jgi:hypothetical protein